MSYDPFAWHDARMRAEVGGYGVGMSDTHDTGLSDVSQLRPRDPDEVQFIAIAMRDPVGELYHVLEATGSLRKDLNNFNDYTEAVTELQGILQVPKTGVVDDFTMVALDHWGSSFTTQLATAIDMLFHRGYSAEYGLPSALAGLQERLGDKQTGALDKHVAKYLRSQVYQPSDDELRTWLDLETPKTRTEYYADIQHGYVADVAENVKKVGSVVPAIFNLDLSKFLKDVAKNPLTYGGMGASILLRSLGPVAIVPLAGVFLYELGTALSEKKT